MCYNIGVREDFLFLLTSLRIERKVNVWKRFFFQTRSFVTFAPVSRMDFAKYAELLNLKKGLVISMKTTILLRQVTIDDDVRNLIEKKIKKLDKFFLDNAEAAVKLSKKREIEILELTITASGSIFRSEVEGPSYCHAIDTAVNVIERQIRKNKTRLEKKLRDGAFLDGAYSFDPVEEETEFKIRKKSFDLKPMTAEEAIMQMNLIGHEFFVYEDQETEEINVVYKRKDGAYGLIETHK